MSTATYKVMGLYNSATVAVTCKKDVQCTCRDGAMYV